MLLQNSKIKKAQKQVCIDLLNVYNVGHNTSSIKELRDTVEVCVPNTCKIKNEVILATQNDKSIKLGYLNNLIKVIGQGGY